MKKIEFSTSINAPREKVWKVLWGDITYPQWTSVFSEGSKAVTDWKEGSKVQFLSGTGEGMYSVIEKRSDNEFMSFKHIGMMKDGKELPLDDETKKWSGAMENYTLTESNGTTNLKVEIDMAEEHLGYFEKTFPKALEKVKEIAEK